MYGSTKKFEASHIGQKNIGHYCVFEGKEKYIQNTWRQRTSVCRVINNSYVDISYLITLCEEFLSKHVSCSKRISTC